MARLDIKGINQCLVFIFGHGTAEEYEEIIRDKLAASPRLFEGSPVQFQGDGLQTLSHEEIIALQRLCLDNGMHFVSPAPAPVKSRPDNTRLSQKTSAHDLIIQRTLRSGQRVHSEGSVIIWGDVHESAEITAGKDVIVLGKLEGMAHAGCYGDVDSLIFALSLQPKQLRIADRISRSSGEMVKPNMPEVAYVSENNICIKEYSSRDPILR